VYSSRIAAIAEASSLGIRGVPLALLLFVAALVFVIPMAPNLPKAPVTSSLGQTSMVPFAAPLERYRIGPRFGETREMTGLGGRQVHSGLDLLAPAGTPVMAMAEGVVVRRAMSSRPGSNGRYGNYILVRHGEYLVFYTDIASPQVTPGARVHHGQLLGYLEDSPYPAIHSRPRLHIEVIKGGVCIDPLPLLAR
jgi:murein DD-endopeptidase MepM/ murein hydrolase activator NlpD